MAQKELKEKLEGIIPESLILKNVASLEEYFCITKEKERNILINLTKYLIKNNKDIDSIFTDEEIQKNILLKKIDYIIYKDIFFEENSNKILNNKKELILEFLKKNNENNNFEKEKELEEICSELRRILYEEKYEVEKFNAKVKEGREIAKKLHWKYLPIYDEEMMENRGCLPEEDIDEYYYQYHALEDLCKEIKGEGIKFELLNGDKTLDKPIDFKVYTVRWNSYDTYRISRTIYGWDVKHISISPETLKNGEGGFFANLKHDSVFFPEDGVAYAMEETWKLADNGKLSFYELKERLQEIAIWISDVEKNMRIKQPKWCNYYYSY